MRRSLLAFLSLAVALAPVTAQTPPEGPDGGDVAAGAEGPGVDAVEWEALMRGSETAAQPRGGLQALLESANVDLVVFYKNLNESQVADEDDAYHVFARRCAGALAEDCDPAQIVFDHLVFTRAATPDGGFSFQVVALTAENPVGTVLAAPPINPFGAPSAPGPVWVADRDDPRRDPTALSRLAEELAAATQSVIETVPPAPPSEAGVERSFIPPEQTTYPYPYERLAAVFDDSDAPDLLFVPTPSGDLAPSPPRGGHGSLDVTQSRATLLVSGRGARRAPLSADDEAALAIRHVDIAPTVAKVLGIPPHDAARYLNGRMRDPDNLDAPEALLLRQDGKPLDALLEPRINTFVIVIDGMEPQNVTPALTPNLCRITSCPGTLDPDPESHATVYEQARAMMVTQTNANHTAMLTGAYGDASGLFANSAWNRALGAIDPQERPELILTDTLFDVFRAEAPQMATAAVLGKQKLRALYDCTRSGSGCGTSAANPEGIAVTHVRPDYLRGAFVVGGSSPPNPEIGDCPVVHSSVTAPDACIMDQVIELSATQDPDFTFVNLGTVDNAQHFDGPGTPGAIAAIEEADRQIGRLVAYLKESGKWRTTVLFVTADHSFSLEGPPPPQRIELASLFTADRTANPAAWGAGLAEPFVIVSNGGTGHVYLRNLAPGATALSAAQQDALARMRRVALESAPGVPRAGVSEALYRLANPADPDGLAATLDGAHPDWHLATERAGELIVTALASGPNPPLATGGNRYETATGPGYVISEGPSAPQSALTGDHGHPGTRHVPFIIASGGDFVVDQRIAASNPAAVDEGDDTAALPEQAEPVDIAATVAWIYGLVPAGDYDARALLPASRGRVLREAFTGGVPPIDAVGPNANRALVLIFDGNNSVRIHELMADCGAAGCANPHNLPVAAVRSLLLRDTDARSDTQVGTLASFGAISAHPTVTFPNHNVVGSGAYPGHLGVVHNRYYERDIETERDPIDPTDPRNPIFFFSSALLRSDVETLHEAVHRAFGNWQPAPADPQCDPESEVCDGPDGAFTASVNEPSARGADFASLETVSSENLPAVFAALTANAAEFNEDTDDTCARQSPDNYGQESVLDHLGQAQARSLYVDPSTSSFTRPGGVAPLVIDESAGAAHPDPKYLIENFTLTDGAGHEFGPHGNCARRGYRDTSSRLGRVLGELRNHGRFDSEGEPARIGETFILLTGDHGMEEQDTRPGRHDEFDVTLSAADVEYVRQETFVYLLTMDVAIAGVPEHGLASGFPVSLTFTVTDGDRRGDGSASPIAGATVTASSDAGSASGVTNAAGQLTLAFTPAGGELRIVVDKDANAAAGGRTVGSSSPDPEAHGVVAKQSYNDRVITLPEPCGWLALALGAALVVRLGSSRRGRRA